MVFFLDLGKMAHCSERHPAGGELLKAKPSACSLCDELAPICVVHSLNIGLKIFPSNGVY